MLFLQEAKAARQCGLIQDQDFAYAGHCDGLKFCDSGEDGKLSSTDAGGFKSQVVQASNRTSCSAEIERSARTGAFKIERMGESALDLHIQLKYKRGKFCGQVKVSLEEVCPVSERG